MWTWVVLSIVCPRTSLSFLSFRNRSATRLFPMTTMNKRASYIRGLVNTWQPKLVNPYYYVDSPKDLTGVRWLFPASRCWYSLDTDDVPSKDPVFGVIAAIYIPAIVLDDVDSFVDLNFTVRRPDKSLRLEFSMPTSSDTDANDHVVQKAIDNPDTYVRMELFSPGFMSFNLTTVRIAMCSNISESFYVEVLYLRERWETQTFSTGEWDLSFDDRSFQWYRCQDPTRYDVIRMMEALDKDQRLYALRERDPCLYDEKEDTVMRIDQRTKHLNQWKAKPKTLV